MTEYTVSLALFDFVPVICSGIGLFFIAKMIARLDATSGKIAYLAGTLIVLGGLSKATWKLIFASSGHDIAWMNDMLFIFLAPGFTLLSWALWSAQRSLVGKAIPKNVWLRPLALILLFGTGAIAARFAQPDERYWFFILLTLTTFANLAVSILLIKQSLQQGLKLAAVLFLFNLIAVFTLSGMARIPEQTVALQWIEESINAFSQGSFALAAWMLAKDTAVNRQPDASISNETMQGANA